MCSSETLVSPDTALNLGARVDMATESVPQGCGSMMTPNAVTTIQSIDQYRLQLYNYALQAERLRFVQNYAPGPSSLSPYAPRWPFAVSLLQNRLTNEEPKPQHSYIGLIAMAILSSPESKLVLSDIYQYILDNYSYFRSRGPGWRNSIRHNLSLNDCFIKAGRSANGKGHYWAIHPANVDDFKRGDFRRRKAQRKVRKHMGLAVEDDGNDSPSPPPLTPPPNLWPATPIIVPTVFPTTISRKRQFDVASLLAPDDSPSSKRHLAHHLSSSSEEDEPVDVDVVTSNESIVASSSQRQPPSLPNASSTTSTTAWCFPNILNTSSPEHQQLVAKYYEQLNQARTIQLYQQIQIQKRFCTTDVDTTRIEEIDNSE